MTLQDIFDQLTFGELSQLSIGGGEGGEIIAANYPKVLAHVTLGLTALYKRFALKEGGATIRIDPARKTYRIDTEGDAYFVTGYYDEEFNNDILKIEEVLDSAGKSYVLNDRNNPYAMSTPSPTVLRLPEQWVDDLVPETVTLVYRANHPKITIGAGFNPAAVYMELPDSHLEALLMFVASRAHNPVGMTNEFHAGNSYYAKYLAACQELENQNLQQDQAANNTRFSRGGWV